MEGPRPSIKLFTCTRKPNRSRYFSVSFRDRIDLRFYVYDTPPPHRKKEKERLVIGITCLQQANVFTAPKKVSTHPQVSCRRGATMLTNAQAEADGLFRARIPLRRNPSTSAEGTTGLCLAYTWAETPLRPHRQQASSHPVEADASIVIKQMQVAASTVRCQVYGNDGTNGAWSSRPPRTSQAVCPSRPTNYTS